MAVPPFKETGTRRWGYVLNNPSSSHRPRTATLPWSWLLPSLILGIRLRYEIPTTIFHPLGFLPCLVGNISTFVYQRLASWEGGEPHPRRPRDCSNWRIFVGVEIRAFRYEFACRCPVGSKGCAFFFVIFQRRLMSRLRRSGIWIAHAARLVLFQEPSSCHGIGDVSHMKLRWGFTWRDWSWYANGTLGQLLCRGREFDANRRQFDEDWFGDATSSSHWRQPVRLVFDHHKWLNIATRAVPVAFRACETLEQQQQSNS